MEVRGLEKGWGPEWSPGSSLLQSGPAPHPPPHFPSLPFTPRGRGRGRPRPDALKRGRGRRVWLANAEKGRAWGQKRSSRQRVGPAEQVGQPTPAALARLAILSALVSVTQAPPHSSSVRFYCSPLPPHRAGPDASNHTHGRTSLTRVLLQPLRLGSSTTPKVPAGPHRLAGGR